MPLVKNLSDWLTYVIFVNESNTGTESREFIILWFDKR